MSCWAASIKPPCPSRVWTVAAQWFAEEVCFQEARDVPVWMSWRDNVPGPEAEVVGALAQRRASLSCIAICSASSERQYGSAVRVCDLQLCGDYGRSRKFAGNAGSCSWLEPGWSKTYAWHYAGKFEPFRAHAAHTPIASATAHSPHLKPRSRDP